MRYIAIFPVHVSKCVRTNVHVQNVDVNIFKMCKMWIYTFSKKNIVWGVPRALLQTHFIMCSPALHFIHDHLQGVLACLSIDLPCFDLTSCPASAPSARVAHPTHPHHHSQHRGATHVNIHIFMFKRCPARGGSLYGLNFSRISSYVYQSSPTLYLKLQPACGNRAEAIRIT